MYIYICVFAFSLQVSSHVGSKKNLNFFQTNLRQREKTYYFYYYESKIYEEKQKKTT